jgi:hypothetical protein
VVVAFVVAQVFVFGPGVVGLWSGRVLRLGVGDAVIFSGGCGVSARSSMLVSSVGLGVVVAVVRVFCSSPLLDGGLMAVEGGSLV